MVNEVSSRVKKILNTDKIRMIKIFVDDDYKKVLEKIENLFLFTNPVLRVKEGYLAYTHDVLTKKGCYEAKKNFLKDINKKIKLNRMFSDVYKINLEQNALSMGLKIKIF